MGHIRCSFTFDPESFPDPKSYLSEIKQNYGVQICVWSASFPPDRAIPFLLNFLGAARTLLPVPFFVADLQ